jgi:PBSX family phage portal protein
MATKTQVIEDDSGNLEISGIRKSSSRSVTAPPPDPFRVPANVVYDLDGVSKTTRAGITRKITKFNRAKDKTESKRVDGKEFLSGYDAFDVVQPANNLDGLALLYEASPTHYAAVNAKVSNIVGLGYRFVENSKTKRQIEETDDEEKLKKLRRTLSIKREALYDELDELNEEYSFTETLMRFWRDYETMGNGYIEIGRRKDGTIGYIGHIPAQTMRVRRNLDGFVQVSGSKMQYFAHFGAGIDESGNPRTVRNPVGEGKPNEVIHLAKHTPTSTYYGVPDIVAAAAAVAGNDFAARYNLDYFENKAVPRYVIIVKGAKLRPEDEAELMSFFDTDLKGQNHRSIYIPLPADTVDNKVTFEMNAIETGIQDSSFTNYRKANNSDIFAVHRVPQTKVDVSGGTNLAVARDADKTFKEQVCAPEQSVLEKRLKKVFKEMTDSFDFKLNEMSLTDANTQSQIDERRRKTGVETANEQRARRGDPSIEGGDELFDMNAAAKIAELNNATTRRGQDKAAERRAAASPTNPQAGAGANANGNPQGTRQRDTQRTANATDSAGQGRNAKGDGRTQS